MDKKYQKVILTVMCLIKKEDKYLFQYRKKHDWPGLTLPGGHVEENERVEEATIREIKEETNLDIISLKLKDCYEWKWEDGRYLAFLYESNEFKGEMRNSKEGELLFLTKEEIKNYPLSQDLDKILEKYDIYLDN